MTKDKALAKEPVTRGVDWSNVGDIPCVSTIKRLPDGGIEVLAVEYGPKCDQKRYDDGPDLCIKVTHGEAT